MSISKGSSARAPTLSSTLKQTKSLQTLQSPKATNGKRELKAATTSKPIGTKSSRHVRTVDGTGSTPILSSCESRDYSALASVGGIATTDTGRTTRARGIDLLASYLQDTALEATGPPEDISLPTSATASRAASRATSSSTVKAAQSTDNLARTQSVVASSLKARNSSGNVRSNDAENEHDDSTTAPPTRGRSAQYQPATRRTTVSEVSMQSSSTSDLRATATEFVPALKDTSNNVADIQPPPILPDLCSLDGYGIPWFYHMYPVQWIFPPISNKNRSKFPKKLRPKKQQSAIDPSAVEPKHRPDTHDFTRTESTTGTSVTDGTTSALSGLRNDNTTPQRQTPDVASDDIPETATLPYSKPFAGPFSSQLDMIAHQAALQPKTNVVQPLRVDLTTISNVSTQYGYLRDPVQSYNTLLSRRRNTRNIGNGLYGGRGNVGMPLYATAPFPMPVPPMGKPIEQTGGSHTSVRYTIGSQGCGTMEIEKAAEYGGIRACNTCGPDH
ncbi:hypothetical protein E8E12_002798 [Didymella heteroderae]|uniref:Uncharacterized protein n=1 Tax=Didymella heteroderae TaxID=1769908 RepID=A0A9P4WRE1_9PLEO|nr:hypothetical protein E8E12_002798 [Didymella heteroderae]